MKSAIRIRRKLKSLRRLHAITCSMESVSRIRMQAVKRSLERFAGYASSLERMADFFPRHLYLQASSGVEGYIIFSTDRGLVGSFNLPMVEYLSSLEPGSVIYAVGRKLKPAIVSLNLSPRRYIDGLESGDFIEKLTTISDTAFSDFISGTISRLRVVGHARNADRVEERVVLPFPRREGMVEEEAIFEPTPEEIYRDFQRQLLFAVVTKAFLEFKLCEHRARLFMMHQAADKSSEMIEKTFLEYNKARQEAITSEIQDVYGGKRALEGE
ncbi:F0F1 ATP synthase subunit gamma [bacterium]|nr:F0F1 ATP synthase subunit gamma [bacterium]